MKKTINGILYDTETATMIADWDNNRMSSDIMARAETLYLAPKGAYFSTSLGFNTSGSRTNFFTPLTDTEALAWCQEHDCYDGIKKHLSHLSHLITEA